VVGGFFARLVARGKTIKQAMSLRMWELLVLMNTLAARRQARDPAHAA
jgi:hypothetical protein